MKGKSLGEFFHFVSIWFNNVYPKEAVIPYLRHNIRAPSLLDEFKGEKTGLCCDAYAILEATEETRLVFVTKSSDYI